MKQKRKPKPFGRPPVAEPRTRRVTVLLTEAEAEALDTLRGSVPAGTWIRVQIMPVLKGMFANG